MWMKAVSLDSIFYKKSNYVLKNEMQALKSKLLKIAIVVKLLACRSKQDHWYREVTRTKNI